MSSNKIAIVNPDASVSKFMSLPTFEEEELIGGTYPENLPDRPLVFEYAYHDVHFNREQLTHCIHTSLQDGILPSEDIAVSFAAEVLRDLKFPMRKEGKVGSLPPWKQGQTLPMTYLVEFVKKAPSQELSGSTADLGRSKDLAYLMWILIQSRLSRVSYEHGKTYARKLFPGFANLLKEIPFNLSEQEVTLLGMRPEAYVPRTVNHQIKFLSACLDWFLCKCADPLLLKLRYATLTTRFEDHLSWRQLGDVKRHIRSIPVTKFLTLLYCPETEDELRTLLQEGVGLTDHNALAPYSRSMGLVPKSPYSMTANPNLSTYFTVILGLMVRSTFFNLAAPARHIDHIIINAVRAVKFLLINTEARPFVATPELLDVVTNLVKLKPPVEMNFATYIHQARRDGAWLSRSELNWLKTKLVALPAREGSLRNFILTMTCREEQASIPPQINELIGADAAYYGREDDESSEGYCPNLP
uniref:Nucleoprotein n=1 Tax=Wenling dimarhabdovirus 9 TaxID=2116362 RepID=A0A2P1GNJ0_9RHAB|nr:nucleoprotein [Wenling dimarhabdovirus 9]